MQLSKTTIKILNNFSTINKNLMVDPGNRLATVANSHNILAEAYIEENFPSEFTIYDLFEFLGAYNLFKEPNLTFHDTYVTISENGNFVNYRYTDRDILVRENSNILTALRKRRDTVEDVFIQLDLSSELIVHLKKASTVLQADDFCVIGDGSQILIRITDKKNVNANQYSSIVGTTDKTFNANFKIDNLRLLLDSYTLMITPRFGCFEAKNMMIKYFITMENDSNIPKQ